MRVALTGVTGFTGRFLLNALERARITPVPLQLDLRNPITIDEAVEAHDFDQIIHLAGNAFVNVGDWRGFYEVNQLGTLHLLDALAREKPGARCILASSALVYDTHREWLITEDGAINPSNHYAISKYGMEKGANFWRDRLEIGITRPFNYTGVGQGVQYLIPKIVDHFRRRADEIELGNTWVRRDFGDVRSVADAYVGLALAKEVPPIVNIATGMAASINDILAYLTKISDHSMTVKVNPAYVRKGDAEVLVGNTDLLASTLPDWQPHRLEDTLAWMYAGC